jgi:hypothetical protein
MGLKTMIAAHSNGAVVMANGFSPAPQPKPAPTTPK